MMKRTPLALLATACLPVLLTVGSGPAAAQNTGVLNGCVDVAGTLRLVGAINRTCRTNETFVSWNIQGPAGPTGATGATGPRGPAGPQTMLGAVVLGTGVVQVSTIPAGATLTVTRQGPGNYRVQVTGLGNQCPLMTANAVDAATAIYLQGGSCGGGSLSLPVRTLNGQDAPFMMTVIGLGPATAAAAAPAAPAALSPPAAQSTALTVFGER